MSGVFDQTPYPEHSAKLVFSGGTAERAAEKRAPDCLENALGHEQTRVMVFAKGRVFVLFEDGDADPLFPLGTIDLLKPLPKDAVLLGHENDRPIIAMPSGHDPEVDGDSLPDNIKAIDYRSLAIQGLLPQARMGEVAQGASLLAWHHSHRYCSRCGHRSNPADGGYRRHCSNCGSDHFPRTDPVVIMLAIDGDRCLLGRSHNWKDGMYSALAGFVEPGETFEDAVRREISEEAGVAIGKVQYQANQPWPFPHTLMIGCFAEAISTEIIIDYDELDDCRWFSRRQILQVLDEKQDAGFFVPPKMAIAHHLIDHWAKHAG